MPLLDFLRRTISLGVFTTLACSSWEVHAVATSPEELRDLVRSVGATFSGLSRSDITKSDINRSSLQILSDLISIIGKNPKESSDRAALNGLVSNYVGQLPGTSRSDTAGYSSRLLEWVGEGAKRTAAQQIRAQKLRAKILELANVDENSLTEDQRNQLTEMIFKLQLSALDQASVDASAIKFHLGSSENAIDALWGQLSSWGFVLPSEAKSQVGDYLAQLDVQYGPANPVFLATVLNAESAETESLSTVEVAIREEFVTEGVLAPPTEALAADSPSPITVASSPPPGPGVYPIFQSDSAPPQVATATTPPANQGVSTSDSTMRSPASSTSPTDVSPSTHGESLDQVGSATHLLKPPMRTDVANPVAPMSPVTTTASAESMLGKFFVNGGSDSRRHSSPSLPPHPMYASFPVASKEAKQNQKYWNEVTKAQHQYRVPQKTIDQCGSLAKQKSSTESFNDYWRRIDPISRNKLKNCCRPSNAAASCEKGFEELYGKGADFKQDKFSMCQVVIYETLFEENADLAADFERVASTAVPIFQKVDDFRRAAAGVCQTQYGIEHQNPNSCSNDPQTAKMFWTCGRPSQLPWGELAKGDHLKRLYFTDLMARSPKCVSVLGGKSPDVIKESRLAFKKVDETLRYNSMEDRKRACLQFKSNFSDSKKITQEDLAIAEAIQGVAMTAAVPFSSSGYFSGDYYGFYDVFSKLGAHSQNSPFQALFFNLSQCSDSNGKSLSAALTKGAEGLPREFVESLGLRYQDYPISLQDLQIIVNDHSAEKNQDLSVNGSVRRRDGLRAKLAENGRVQEQLPRYQWLVNYHAYDQKKKEIPKLIDEHKQSGGRAIGKLKVDSVEAEQFLRDPFLLGMCTEGEWNAGDKFRADFAKFLANPDSHQIQEEVKVLADGKTSHGQFEFKPKRSATTISVEQSPARGQSSSDQSKPRGPATRDERTSCFSFGFNHPSDLLNRRFQSQIGTNRECVLGPEEITTLGTRGESLFRVLTAAAAVCGDRAARAISVHQVLVRERVALDLSEHQPMENDGSGRYLINNNETQKRVNEVFELNVGNELDGDTCSKLRAAFRFLAERLTSNPNDFEAVLGSSLGREDSKNH